MKVICLLKVGPLNRLGYQFNTNLIFENYSIKFDEVLVISNSEETVSIPNFKNIIRNYEHIIILIKQ